MNPIKLIASFAPFIVFALLAGNSLNSVKIAIVVSLAVTILLGYKDLRAGFILSWATLGFFYIFSNHSWFIFERMGFGEANRSGLRGACLSHMDRINIRTPFCYGLCSPGSR